MDKSKFAFFSAIALLAGTVSYFVIEGVSLHKKNKKAKSLQTSINNLEDAKALVAEDSESKEIVTESLNDELKKKEEISRKIEGSKNRIGIAIEATIRLTPSILDFLASLVSSSSSNESDEDDRIHYYRVS
jgi:hypothetical protein